MSCTVNLLAGEHKFDLPNGMLPSIAPAALKWKCAGQGLYGHLNLKSSWKNPAGYTRQSKRVVRRIPIYDRSSGPN